MIIFQDIFTRLVKEDENESEDSKKKAKPSSNTCSVLEKLFLVFKFLFKNNMEHRDDYKVALIKTKTFKKKKLAQQV